MLNANGFLVFAEHATQCVGNFANRSMGLDRGEDCRQKIFPCSGAALEFGEGGFDASGISPRAQSI